MNILGADFGTIGENLESIKQSYEECHILTFLILLLAYIAYFLIIGLGVVATHTVLYILFPGYRNIVNKDTKIEREK